MHHCGIFSFFYYINRHKRIVVTYHNVIPDHLFDNTPHLGVSHAASVFEKQITLLKRKISNLVITFDDGYQNQYQIASKILNKYGMQGVFFITFQSIENGKTLLIDKITQWISYVPTGTYTIYNEQYNITHENRNPIASIIYEKLLSHYFLWNTIENELNNAYLFDSLTLDNDLKKLRFTPLMPNELADLKKDGHKIAAHSWDHKPLATLPIEDQEKDFELCQTYAKKYCNLKWYSYPYGGKKEVSIDTMRLCKQYGFSEGFTNVPTPLFDESSVEKNYQISRINLPNIYNACILNAKLSGFECFLKKILQSF